MFKHFFKKRKIWADIITYLSELDCLCSLASTALKEEGMTRPVLALKSAISQKAKPMIELRKMRHPTVTATNLLGNSDNANFIPNDTLLGGDYPPIRLVTGPNMGGKSTYLR